jgi:REP element-mobilizing transposase RayT
MGRTPRSHLPGAVFHLTARTQGGAAWFTAPLRSRIVEQMAAALAVSDAQLVAYAVMSNHVHLVIRQGTWPLGRIMQLLLRRIAGLVQRSHGVEGHIFERRFRDRVCLDPEYARNAIVYTHLNPVRAGAVDDPAAYPWTSHSAFETGVIASAPMRGVLAVDNALELFAPRNDLSMDELRRAYRRYVGWRLRCDRQAEADLAGCIAEPPPPAPPVRCGDLCWTRSFSPRTQEGAAGGAARADLGEIARRTLANHDPCIALSLVRSTCKGRSVVRARRDMARRMSDAGYRGCEIARYLRVSDPCVSRMLAPVTTMATGGNR